MKRFDLGVGSEDIGRHYERRRSFLGLRTWSFLRHQKNRMQGSRTLVGRWEQAGTPMNLSLDAADALASGLEHAQVFSFLLKLRTWGMLQRSSG